MNGLTIIDPPVGPYSPVEEIKAWIEELKAIESSYEVARAIKEADALLLANNRT